MRKALTLVLCVGVLLAVAGPAFAQRYPPPRPPRCNVQDRTVEPGQTVLFGGKFFRSNSAVEAGFHQKQRGDDVVVIVHTTTDGSGTWFVSITIPNDVENGDAVFGAKGRDKAGNRFRCIIPVRVVGAANPVNASASEPAGITTGMATALVLALFGAHLVVRRRRMKSLVA